MRYTLKVVGVGLLMTAAMVARPASASAQVVQSLNLNIGVFMPRGEDTRVANDVWLANLPVYRFEVKDFTGGEVSGEWNFAFGNRVELGLGAAFYQRTIDTNYRDYTNPNGTEVESKFKLRTAPLTAVVRLMPFGNSSTFQPYIGGGIGVINWRYSEVGEFIDFNDNNNVYRARYTADGNKAAPVILAGFRAPVGGDVWAITLEGRYIRAEGDLNTNDFLGSKIDMGGTTLRFGVLLRF
jgi:opacity protein-like surface antigen